jgi:hypothetical protein
MWFVFLQILQVKKVFVPLVYCNISTMIKYHRVERGQSVFSSRHHCGCSLGQAGILPEPGRRGPGHARSRPSRQPACGLLTTHPASGLLTTQPASGPLTIGRRCRRRARSRTPPTRTPGARVPRDPGTRVAGLEVITVRVHSGHDLFSVRAESARPAPAEKRA